VVENLGNNAAIGVIPASETGAVPCVEGILEDGLMLTEGVRLTGGGVVQ